SEIQFRSLPLSWHRPLRPRYKRDISGLRAVASLIGKCGFLFGRQPRRRKVPRMRCRRLITIAKQFNPASPIGGLAEPPIVRDRRGEIQRYLAMDKPRSEDGTKDSSPISVYCLQRRRCRSGHWDVLAAL